MTSSSELLPSVDMTDDELAAAPIEYQDWSPETSFCVSGPLPGTKDAAAKNPRGVVRAPREAVVWAKRTFGDRLIARINHPTRWCFRVRK